MVAQPVERQPWDERDELGGGSGFDAFPVGHWRHSPSVARSVKNWCCGNERCPGCGSERPDVAVPFVVARSIGYGGPLLSALPALWTESEWWVFVGYQDERVADHAVGPAEDPEDEVEEAAWVATGEEDREPSDDHGHHGRDPEEAEHDDVRDRE